MVPEVPRFTRSQPLRLGELEFEAAVPGDVAVLGPAVCRLGRSRILEAKLFRVELYRPLDVCHVQAEVDDPHVPLPDDGTVRGAVSLSGPESRIDGISVREEYADEVMDVANIIELSITYS